MDNALAAFEPAILDTDARVVFFPVRHHSPAASRALQDVARLVRPDAVLIEGPADFNPRLTELSLPHELPIAIYSYVRGSDGARRVLSLLRLLARVAGASLGPRTRGRSTVH